MDLKSNLLKQIVRFGLVGGSAALVNFIVVIFFVEFGLLQPMYANIIAFGFAFQVSYFGHRNWTFGESNAQHRTAVPRLLIISAANFFANEGLFYFFLNTFHLPYPLALLLVLIILPIVVFPVNKLWVFR